MESLLSNNNMFETIIKKSIEGGYNGVLHQNQKGKWTGVRVLEEDDMAWVVLDPLFWQALGKASSWEKKEVIDMEGDSGRMDAWLYYAMDFHNKNLTEGWDSAVSYLQSLVDNN